MPFPLTLSLSLWERESTDSATEFVGAIRPPYALELFPDWPIVLPVPEGEGRGGGEGFVVTTTVSNF